MPDRKADMWDARLIKAYFLNKHYQVNGFPVWYEESDKILFTAKKRVIRSLQVVQRAEAKFRENDKNNNQHGVTFYAVPVVKSGETRPTRAEWIQSQIEKRNKTKDAPSSFAEEALKADNKRAEMVRRSEERATAKMADMSNDDKIEDDSL